MLQFAWPAAGLALLLPVLAAWLLPPAAPLATPLRVPFFREAARWQRAAAASRPRVRSVPALLVWMLLVAAACRPQWIGEPVGVPASGRSLLLALDLSGSIGAISMDGESGPALLRRTARQFIAGRAGDRVGLVVFGSKAHVQAPPSFDLGALAGMVEESFVGLAGEGTALGDAIALGVARLRAMPREERVLVLLTDGSSTEGAMKLPEAALLAREHGVRVHAIGLGEPRKDAGPSDGEGLDEPALREIAARTGGHYFRAGDARALERIYDTIGRHEPALRDTRRYRPAAELYPWPLALALLLAVAALLAAWRKARR
ncbi:MAG: VWA domain-containing protein [Betaproteobacteria bacterium]